jgi:hypothetical protein
VAARGLCTADIANGKEDLCHFILLRHQDGDDWDYVVIEHLGTSTTLKANPAHRLPECAI